MGLNHMLEDEVSEEHYHDLAQTPLQWMEVLKMRIFNYQI